jgi:bifunctional UDP-N-acetylglucosamine pyrophosphorylase / glucosamine-1-phosphate N-acetyltransferase
MMWTYPESRAIMSSFMPGVKFSDASTLILQGANLGYEAPVTIEDCQIGPDVKLNGGFFRGAVFLEKASVGSGAHVREGTILEEQAVRRIRSD